MTPTADATRLRGLAGRMARIQSEVTHPEAILLTGSAATGHSDPASDLDLILYHREIPSDAAFAEARRRAGATGMIQMFPRSEEGFGEQIKVDGVDVQLAHTTVQAWEDRMAGYLDRHELDFASPKTLAGLLEGRALWGHDLVAAWQRRARAYPDGLAVAIVEANLSLVPTWKLVPRLATRDAALWQHQARVANCFSILHIVAALNRTYFSEFQFKRARHFIDGLSLAPPRLADRLEGVLAAEVAASAPIQRDLLADTLPLVERHLPQVELTAARRLLVVQAGFTDPGSAGPD